jgi:cytochrome c biogenesis protein CcmG/thiol:disulfide interchange protein DsbE
VSTSATAVEEEGADSGPPRRKKRTAVVIAVVLGVVLALLIGVLATREPATDRQADSPLIGRAAPAIEGETLEGEEFDLDALRGQWVVVNFFATWCVPCRQEHPELVRFAEEHAEAGDASVVSVVFDDEPEQVQSYFDENGGTWPVVPGEGTGVILDYAVSGVPESFIVAPSGVVVAKVTGGVTADGLDQIIAEVQARSGATPEGEADPTQAGGS